MCIIKLTAIKFNCKFFVNMINNCVKSAENKNEKKTEKRPRAGEKLMFHRFLRI